MPTTVTKFLNNAAADAGVVEIGGSLTATRLAFWLDTFNNLVLSMSADRLFLFYVPDVAYTCQNVEGQEIGPGGAQFDTSGGTYTRPVFVESASAIVGNARRFPLNIQTEAEWQSNPRRGASDPDGPIDFYYAAGIAKGIFNMASKPYAGQVIRISQWNPLKTFDSGDVGLNMEDYYPAEYIRALRLSLAVANLPAHKMSASQELISNAQTAVGTIRNLNAARIGQTPQQPAAQ